MLFDELKAGSEAVQEHKSSDNHEANQSGKYNINTGQTGGLQQKISKAAVGQIIGRQKAQYIANIQGDNARIGDEIHPPKKKDFE
jgi:hypothetical protein